MEQNTREADIIINWKKNRKNKADDGKKRNDSSTSATSDDRNNEKNGSQWVNLHANASETDRTIGKKIS